MSSHLMSELIVRLSRYTIYFQMYAVRDLLHTPPVIDESKVDSTRLLPSESDNSELTKNFSFLVARVLKQYMPFLRSLVLVSKDTFDTSFMWKWVKNLKL